MNADLNLNPMAMWRDWIVKSEAQWSETMSGLLKDEGAGAVLKRQIDEARMAHRQFGEMAQAALAAAYLPTRADIEALDERMGKLEDGLAQVSAQVAALREALVAQGAATVASNRRRCPTRCSARWHAWACPWTTAPRWRGRWASRPRKPSTPAAP
jgi:16S rRNA G1207 methylase RsmC